jgi:hypothetical protein
MKGWRLAPKKSVDKLINVVIKMLTLKRITKVQIVKFWQIIRFEDNCFEKRIAISEKRITHSIHSLSFLNHQQCSCLCLKINESFKKKITVGNKVIGTEPGRCSSSNLFYTTHTTKFNWEITITSNVIVDHSPSLRFENCHTHWTYLCVVVKIVVVVVVFKVCLRIIQWFPTGAIQNTWW